MKKGKYLLLVYLIVLVWILLFKFSISADDFREMMQLNMRRINVIPFGDSAKVNGMIDRSELWNNFLIFVPFGGLLGIVAKKSNVWQKIGYLFIFSFMIELMQYLLQIGASDITDILTNVSGGVLGMGVYALLRRQFPNGKLDERLVMIGSVLLLFSVGLLLAVILIN